MVQPDELRSVLSRVAVLVQWWMCVVCPHGEEGGARPDRPL